MAMLDNFKNSVEKAKDGIVDRAKNVKDEPKKTVEAYEQALSDSKDIVDFLSKIDSPEELAEADLPECVVDMRNTDSARSKIYSFAVATLGIQVAATLLGSMGIGASVIGSASAIGGTAVLAGVSGLSLGPAPIAVPALVLGTAPKIILGKVVFDYVKKNKDRLLKQNTSLEEAREKVRNWLNESIEKSKKSIAERNERSKQLLAEYCNKTKEASKKIAIQIDDITNTDTNKRILQYNDIIESQYNKQRELELTVDRIMAEYVSLEEENAKLEKQIEKLMQLLVSMECPKAVIENALKGKEE